MKQSCTTYFIAFLFIGIFGLKTFLPCCTAAMQLAKEDAMELAILSATGEGDKNSDAKDEKESEAFFIHYNTQYTIVHTGYIVQIKKCIAHKNAHVQDMFIPVFTPPPEIG